MLSLKLILKLCITIYIYTVNGINANNGRSCDFLRTVQIITQQWLVRDEHINNNSPILLYQTFNISSLRK